VTTRTIFITGANRGIGFALTKAYLNRREYRIFSSYRSPESSGQLLSLADLHPEHLIPLCMDVCDTGQIHEAAAIVRQYTNSLDILINNAGMLIQEDNFGDMTADNLLKTFETNVSGTLLVTQNLLALLKNGTDAKIINMSSEAGSISTWEKNIIGSYAVSKAALNMLSKIMSVQLKEKNIITVTVHPGNIKTDMGPENDTSPEICVGEMLELIDSLKPSDNGRFMRRDKTALAW